VEDSVDDAGQSAEKSAAENLDEGASFIRMLLVGTTGSRDVRSRLLICYSKEPVMLQALRVLCC
jgi:hypothetical protein